MMGIMGYRQRKISTLTFIAMWIALANISGTLARHRGRHLILPETDPSEDASGSGANPNVPEPCIDTYAYNIQTVSTGGIPLPWINNFGDCVASCEFVLQCAAADYSDSNGCWAHLNASDLSQAFYQEDATQVIITRCPADLLEKCFATYDGNNTLINVCTSVCFPQWSQVIDTVGSGGAILFDSSPTNASACLGSCYYSIENCVGVDWVYSGGPSDGYTCFYYTTDTASEMTTTSVQANAVQYRLVSPCADYCQSIWTPYINIQFQLLNFTVLPAIATLDDCRIACITSHTCYAYQAANNGPINCIISDDLWITSFISNAPVSTYIWNQTACNGTTLPPLPEPISMGPTPLLPATPSTEGCNWTNYFQDTQVQGGTANGASSLNDCRAACEQMGTDACTGIDWYKTNPVGQQCVIQMIEEGKHISNPNVDHYDYYCG